MDDLLVWFFAFHAGYRDHEFAVLFYSPYVEVGESARASWVYLSYARGFNRVCVYPRCGIEWL